jgi:hypothetical protein
MKDLIIGTLIAVVTMAVIILIFVFMENLPLISFVIIIFFSIFLLLGIFYEWFYFFQEIERKKSDKDITKDLLDKET